MKIHSLLLVLPLPLTTSSLLLFAKAEAAAKRAKLPSPDELFERSELAKPKFLTTAIEVNTTRCEGGVPYR